MVPNFLVDLPFEMYYCVQYVIGVNHLTQKKHFVDNKKFYDAIIEYKKVCELAKQEGRPEPIIPEYIGKCIIDISTHLAQRYNFANYTFRDEMVSDGIERAVYALHKFNPEKSSNPFAYFTQIVFFAFVVRIKAEKKHSYIKHKSLEHFAIETMLDTNGEVVVDVDFEKSAELISKFENEELPVKPEKKPKTKQDGVEQFFGEDE